MAQAARRRHEGYSAADAALADLNDDGHLRSGHSRIAQASGREIARSNDYGAVEFWDVLGRKSVFRGLQVIENMVARDGIEPPTPAFSECGY